eukprot:GEMP01090244.1.p1 GENE.GEMP01090244.1~~GEMP01090244.1.p1  ORF type:complete len:102 (+),score=1.74 GEMP01090244.1:433-738(+)
MSMRYCPSCFQRFRAIPRTSIFGPHEFVYTIPIYYFFYTKSPKIQYIGIDPLPRGLDPTTTLQQHSITVSILPERRKVADWDCARDAYQTMGQIRERKVAE